MLVNAGHLLILCRDHKRVDPSELEDQHGPMASEKLASGCVCVSTGSSKGL